MVVYQLYNTAVWDLIGPTVSLHGTYQELDERNVKKQFWNGDLRDGVGFYDFCCAFAETSSFGAQLRLQNQLIQFPDLQTAGKCSVLRVELFLTQLFDLWRKITTNDETKPASYFVYMMQKWPAEPQAAPARQLVSSFACPHGIKVSSRFSGLGCGAPWAWRGRSTPGASRLSRQRE